MTLLGHFPQKAQEREIVSAIQFENRTPFFTAIENKKDKGQRYAYIQIADLGRERDAARRFS